MFASSWFVFVAAHAATLVVPDDVATLPDAVAAAQDGDTIVIFPPVGGGAHVVSDAIVVDRELTIRGHHVPSYFGSLPVLDDARVVLDVAAATAAPGFEGLFEVTGDGHLTVEDLVLQQPEADCGNGVDDDGDGRRDASDDDCVGRTGLLGTHTDDVRLFRLRDGAQVYARRLVVQGWSWATSAQVAEVTGNGLGRFQVDGCWMWNNLQRPGGAGEGALHGVMTYFQVFNSLLVDNASATGGAVSADRGVVVLQDNVFWGNEATLGGAVHVDDDSRLEVVRNHFVEQVADVGGAVWARSTLADVHNNIFLRNQADVGAAVAVDGQYQASIAVVENNTFLEQAVGPTVWVADTPWRATNNAFAWEDGAALAVAGTAAATPFDVGHNLVWPPNPTIEGSSELLTSPTHVFADPRFAEFFPGLSQWQTARFWPALDSPLIDAGDPRVRDVGGGPSDIGAYGGERAAVEDADGDRAISVLDCDDEDRSVYPGAHDIAGDGVDQDCDGVDASLLLQGPSVARAGDRLTLRVDHASPGRRVAIVTGRRGGTSVIPGCPSVLDLADARLLNVWILDVTGGADLSLTPPISAAGRVVSFQAIDRATCAVSAVHSVRLR